MVTKCPIPKWGDAVPHSAPGDVLGAPWSPRRRSLLTTGIFNLKFGSLTSPNRALAVPT